MNLKGVGWQWVDTRGKSAQIHHRYQVEKHLVALATAKNHVKLHKPDPTWLRKKKLHEEKEARLEAMPKGAVFEKMAAKSSVFTEQREVLKKIAKATSGTKTEKPATFGKSKNLSANRAAG